MLIDWGVAGQRATVACIATPVVLWLGKMLRTAVVEWDRLSRDDDETFVG